MRMRTKLCFVFFAIFVCVEKSNAELRNAQEFNHIKAEVNLRIQDRKVLRDSWPLEGKNMRCTDYEYRNLERDYNGQIQCQLKCAHTPLEYDCVGIIYSNMKGFTHYCALCKNDILTNSTNGFGFYRNVELCTNGIQNHGESGVDCGGTCEACPTCADGIQNQAEIGIDCGGPCNACPTCTDGIQNQGETGVDCGGSCPSCPSTCPSSCKCKSGQHAVDKIGNCNYWCSKSGYCGAKDAHKIGIDCRGCAGTIDSGSPSCPSSCKCSSGHKEVDESGNCNYWCSKYGNCGMTKDHVIGGIDCRKCKTSANDDTESCPSSCKCKSGQHAVDKTGNCNYWCSKSGYCGETNAHKIGIDCRGCAGWQWVADKKDCEGHDKGMGMMSTIGECARKCKPISSMFAYGTNDFGLERCYDQKCKCVCEPTASADGTCKTKAHNGYRLYRYV